jgi:hypothetical protein
MTTILLSTRRSVSVVVFFYNFHLDGLLPAERASARTLTAPVLACRSFGGLPSTLGCVSMLEIWQEALSEVHAGTLCSGSSSSPDSSELDLVYSMLDVSSAAWLWELALLSHP